MSFRYKSSTITLENYREVFKVCSPDILDEIRSAILDDTEIASFIKSCGNDSYKLGQLRMALRELIPLEFLNTKITGKTIYYIRQCFSKGITCYPLLKYYNSTTEELFLSTSTIECLAEYLYLGVAIEKVDFTIVPNNLVQMVCDGLYKGYPMWLCISEGVKLTDNYLRVLMRGMQLGVDIHPFIDGNWTSEQLFIIFSYARSVNLNDFLSLVTYKFDTDCLNVLLDLFSKGVPIETLCVRDEQGYPVYNQYQMIAIGNAIKDNAITDKMYNPSLSDMDIADMHKEVLSSKNRKLKVSL